MQEIAIAADRLAKRYPRGWFTPPIDALFPVNLDVARGEVLALLGHNGAGKTTLVRLFAGLCAPSEGEARLFGRAAQEPAARASLGYLPERPALPARMLTHEFLAFCARLHGLSRDAARHRTEALLVALELQDVALARLAWLSAGTRQRVALAQALVHEPDVLLLDEPLTGLDPGSRRLVLKLLRDLRSAGTTMLISTHHLTEWSSLIDRVAVLHQGRLDDKGRLVNVLSGLPVRLQFTLPVGVEEPAFGERLPAAGGLYTHQLPGGERERAIEGVQKLGGTVIRVEPVVDALLGVRP